MHKKNHYEKLKKLIKLNDPELLNVMIVDGDLIVAKDIVQLYKNSKKNKYSIKNETTQQFEKHVLNFDLQQDLGISPKDKTRKI